MVQLGEQCDAATPPTAMLLATCQFEASGSAARPTRTPARTTSAMARGLHAPAHLRGRADRRAQLRIRRSSGGSEKLRFVSKDPDIPFPALDGPNDPRTVGATLEILTAGEGTATFELPAANWSANGTGTVFKFLNEAAPGGPSEVKVSLIKQGRILKVQARSTGFPLVDPLVRAAARFKTGLSRSCALFDPGTVRKDEANSFLAKRATAPAVSDCSDAALGFGSPSGAFLD
jgi:hypothetical protein